ncbi:MAG: sulfatase-like hydrolase/transferase [Polyangiaceae bacterium]|nr:sulfatase-like hydrolase/transferase [Polyangiaceae bacterium]
MSTAGTDRISPAVGLCSAALVHAVLAYLFVSSPAYASLLGLDRSPPTANERWLIPLTVVGNSVLFMLPGLAVGLLLLWTLRPRAALAAYAIGGGFGAAVCTIDLVAYAEFGRHMADILRFLALPKGHVAAGATAPWVGRAATLTAASVGFAALCAWSLSWLSTRSLARPTRSFRIASLSLAVGLCLLVAVSPPILAGAWRHSIVIERLFAALPVDLRRSSDDPSRYSDPALSELSEGLSREYRTAFPRLYVQHAIPTRLEAPQPTNVVVIVLESWRSDALGTELMPRLDAWSRRGLRLDRHYAGSTYSEAGLFTLLYGRSALEYHATLDQKLKPELCQLLRRSGYECAYFSGQPLQWMRQEEFVTPESFDHFFHDDRGTWVDWDRRALARLVTELKQPRAKPLFALVFLMSSHFEYQYPPEFERYRPTDTTVRFGINRMEALGAEAAEPLTNRYKNSVGFLDSLVADALDQLPPAHNIVVVTGDHGESIHDDGRFGHGYSFAEVIARTPAFVVGPGIAPRTITTPTLHADFLPTLGTLLAGEPRAELARLGGRDLLGAGPPRTSVLLAHCAWSGNEADALLVSGEQRLRLELDLRRPRATVRGFEDALGRLRGGESASRDTVERLQADFAAELLALSGG